MRRGIKGADAQQDRQPATTISCGCGGSYGRVRPDEAPVRQVAAEEPLAPGQRLVSCDGCGHQLRVEGQP